MRSAHRIRSCRDQTDRRRCRLDRLGGRRHPSRCTSAPPDEREYQADRRSGSPVYRHRRPSRTRETPCSRISRPRSTHPVCDRGSWISRPPLHIEEFRVFLLWWYCGKVWNPLVLKISRYIFDYWRCISLTKNNFSPYLSGPILQGEVRKSRWYKLFLNHKVRTINFSEDTKRLYNGNITTFCLVHVFLFVFFYLPIYCIAMLCIQSNA